MGSPMNDYTERERAQRGEVVPAERSPTETREIQQAHIRTEEDAANGLRKNLARAVEIEADLLERAASATGRDVPNALRAVTDVKSKSLDGLLKLTGRSNPETTGGDIAQMLSGMVERGILKVNVELGPPGEAG